jgi:hypothetical protein
VLRGRWRIVALRSRLQGEASNHLMLRWLKTVVVSDDVAFGGAGAVGLGESAGDGGEVLADAGGEGVQFGLVVGFGTFEPADEFLFAGAFGHHLGEAGHVAGESVQLCAVAAQVGEQLLLAGSRAGPGRLTRTSGCIRPCGPRPSTSPT